MSGRRTRAAAIVFVLTIVAAPAHAQSPDTVPTFGQLFTHTLRDFRYLPSTGNLELLAIGGAAALATHAADSETRRLLSESRTLHKPLEAGAPLRGAPLEPRAAVAAPW